MFKRRTVFVLGAGASREANLPCGDALALEISGKLDFKTEGGQRTGGGDAELYDMFRMKYRTDFNSYLHAAWLIRDGIHLSDSVDNFLNLHQENREANLIAKAAIAKCILEAERKSFLWFDDSNTNNTIKFRNLHATWFAKFMKVLGRDVYKENAADIVENVSFVVFNYDRCLEHFLHHAIQRLYGLSHQDAASICAEVQIDHPYGMVAPLRVESGRGVRFGEKDANWIELAANIKTFTEQTLAGDMLKSVRTQIESADCLIFLGCAFHEPNMLMLSPSIDRGIPWVYGTCFGLSGDDTTNIQAEMSSIFRPVNLHLRNQLKCADLFDTFSRSIAG